MKLPLAALSFVLGWTTVLATDPPPSSTEPFSRSQPPNVPCDSATGCHHLRSNDDPRRWRPKVAFDENTKPSAPAEHVNIEPAEEKATVAPRAANIEEIA
ncbi:hypothetical protein VTI74DRAFT_3546 [Chaetomium olivicolor]